jgi:hypothetical protein
MTGKVHRGGIFVAAAATILAGFAMRANAQTLIESGDEARFQIDFKVPDAAIKALLPSGWMLNVAPQGPAKDCNLRLVFIDRLSIHGADGKPVGKGSNHLAYLVAPVKDASGANVQLVVGGLTEDPADVPGPFGNYLLATTHTVMRMTSSGNGPITDSQDWVLAAATGERLELHIKYERGPGLKLNQSDGKFYSAQNPAYYQINRMEQNLDILRNATTNPPDRVKDFSYKASGGSYAKLFDGTEKVLSWDNFAWINRSVLLP